MVSLSEFTLVGKEDPLGEALPVLAAVQLPFGSMPEIRIVEPAQQEDGLLDFAKAGQCLGQPVGAARIGQALHDGIGSRMTAL